MQMNISNTQTVKLTENDKKVIQNYLNQQQNLSLINVPRINHYNTK